MVSRVLILSVEGELPGGGTESMDFWHEVARRGCSGRLALRTDPQYLVSLMAEYPTAPQLSSLVLTNSAELLQIAGQRGIPHRALSGDVRTLEQETQEWEWGTHQLLMLHLDTRADGLGAARAYAVANAVGRRLVPDLEHTGVLCVVLAGVSDRHRIATPADTFPLQSFAQRAGKHVPGISDEHPIFMSQYHPTSTRCDTVTRFTAEDITRDGADGLVLADRFFAMMAFKLGFAPKYGA